MAPSSTPDLRPSYAAQPLLMRLIYRFALRPRFDRLARPLRQPFTNPTSQPEA